MSGTVSRAFVVTGRVQGVGFRWWTRREAEGLGLGGWVRNRDDGAVEVQVTGSAPNLEAFRGRLAQGPSGARVDGVAEIPAPAFANDPEEFRVVR